MLTSELWDDIVSPLQPYVRLMILLLVLVVTAPLVILAISSRRIAAPLQSLATQVESVAEGNFDSRSRSTPALAKCAMWRSPLARW